MASVLRAVVAAAAPPVVLPVAGSIVSAVVTPVVPAVAAPGPLTAVLLRSRVTARVGLLSGTALALVRPVMGGRLASVGPAGVVAPIAPPRGGRPLTTAVLGPPLVGTARAVVDPALLALCRRGPMAARALADPLLPVGDVAAGPAAPIAGLAALST